MAEFARSHAGQRDELSPLKRRSRGRELGAHGVIVLLGMQGAIFARGEPEHHIERGARRMA